MIEQQLDLHGVLVEVRGGQRVDSFSECGSGDRAGVDRVGLPAGAFLAAFSGGQVRRDPDDALPGGYEVSLEGAGEVPAVLERPHTFGVPETLGPVDQQGEPGLARRCGLLIQELAVGAVDRGEGVGVLVYVRSDQDHIHRPFVSGSVVWADRWLTSVTWGDATLLSSQAGGPSWAAASDTTETSQTPQRKGRHCHGESARRQPKTPNNPSRTATPPPAGATKNDSDCRGSSSGRNARFGARDGARHRLLGVSRRGSSRGFAFLFVARLPWWGVGADGGGSGSALARQRAVRLRDSAWAVVERDVRACR